VHERTADFVARFCDYNAVMPPWLARYQELHDSRARRTSVSIPRQWRVANGTPHDGPRVAICVPHEPELVTPPWEQWGRVADELADGSVIVELSFAGQDWLVREVLKEAGDAVVLEPAAARRAVKAAAKKLKTGKRARRKARA